MENMGITAAMEYGARFFYWGNIGGFLMTDKSLTDEQYHASKHLVHTAPRHSQRSRNCHP